MIIKLVRHGESQQNTKEVEATQIGDSNVSLTQTGEDQAEMAGMQIGPSFISDSLIYVSPYLRTIQTLGGVLSGSGIATSDADVPRIYHDPRLREMEWGFLKDQSEIEREEELRSHFGWFWYRLAGGESPADVYDRMSTFLESMHRQFERKNKSKALIVSHGLSIRVFVMRWFHLTVDEFHRIKNPKNCAIITIAKKNYIKNPQFISGRWAVSGLELRDEPKRQKKLVMA